jgi:hypothetical protein
MPVEDHYTFEIDRLEQGRVNLADARLEYLAHGKRGGRFDMMIDAQSEYRSAVSEVELVMSRDADYDGGESFARVEFESRRDPILEAYEQVRTWRDVNIALGGGALVLGSTGIDKEVGLPTAAVLAVDLLGLRAVCGAHYKRVLIAANRYDESWVWESQKEPLENITVQLLNEMRFLHEDIRPIVRRRNRVLWATSFGVTALIGNALT